MLIAKLTSAYTGADFDRLASGLLVITLAGPRVSAMTMFTPGTLASFGMPRTLPDPRHS